MRSKVFSSGSAVLPIFLAALFLLSTTAIAQQYKVLHDFTCEGEDGCEPNGGLVFDASGNLYGTTRSGGAYNHGTVFVLSRKTSGGWSGKVLHSFNDDGTDGYVPYAGVIVDSAHNLYGTTSSGGAYSEGTIFELSPNKAGGWSEKILFNFGSSGTEGSTPEGGLVADASGNLYGTTLFGGRIWGTAFELSPSKNGSWTWTLMVAFNDGVPDGIYPYDGLTIDTAGNLYGTTYYGGDYDGCSRENAGFYCGTVFELSPSAGGIWTEAVLYSFGGFSTDGYYPQAGVVFDAKGNLFGTTPYGGDVASCQYQDSAGCGTAFELLPTDGTWTENILHNFGLSIHDGTLPSSGLIIDKSGNLYGTTLMTGVQAADGYGTVFELSPKADGEWSEKILHNFATGKSGGNPAGNLTMDSAGNLYGAAGVVFEIIP